MTMCFLSRYKHNLYSQFFQDDDDDDDNDDDDDDGEEGVVS